MKGSASAGPFFMAEHRWKLAEFGAIIGTERRITGRQFRFEEPVMQCPACKKELAETQYRCPACNYGVRPSPLPQTGPRHLGDKCFDNKLAQTYRCGCCRSYGARVRRIATTGNGISRLMDWQCYEFIVASCIYCGLIQHYDPSIVDKTSNGWKSLDFLFDL